MIQEPDGPDPSTIFNRFDPIPLIKEFSNFEILEEIGRGGMGVIYKAREMNSGNEVAIKILLTKHNTYEEDLRRFQREAKFTIGLDHPNIIKTHSIGVVKGNYYIITEYFKGMTLQEKMIRDQITTVDACKIMLEVLTGLSYAHSRGILHRDLKPGNIMIGKNGDVKILDFGLAKHVDQSTRLTITGTVLGTPAYMSPQQASGDQEYVDKTSDIYSAGVMLYEMLCGRTPFRADSSIQMIRQVIEKEPIPIRKFRDDIPEKLEIIVEKCMEKMPFHRYQTVADLMYDIRAFLCNKPIAAKRRSRIAKFYEKAQKHKRVIAIFAILSVNFLLAITALHIKHLIKEKKWREENQKRVEQIKPVWRAVFEDTFESSDSQWYTSSGNWKRDEFTISGSTPLELPLKGEPYSMLQFTAAAEGDRVTYNAGYDAKTGEGIRIIFLFARNITPDSVTGVQIFRDDILIARNYRIRLTPGKYNSYQIMIEDTTISVKVNRDKLLFFNGIIPFKTTSASFSLNPENKEMRISSMSLFTKQFPARTISGDDFFRDRMYDKALDLYLKTADDYKGQSISREALFKAGLCHELRGRYSEAIGIFSGFTRSDGTFYPRALSHIWLCYIHLNDFKNAEILYNRFKEDFTLYEMLAQVPFSTLYTIFQYYQSEAAKQQVFSEAISYYEKAVDTANFLGLEKEGYETINLIGEQYRSAGDYEKAIVVFRRAQAEYPELTSKSAWNQLRIGEVYRLMEDIPSASKEYRKVIQRYPDEEEQKAWASLWLAEMAITYQRDLDLARVICRSAKFKQTLHITASQALLDNAEISDLNTIPSYFKNDILYFKAVSSLYSGNRKKAFELLKSALMVGKKNDWPESLIKKRLAELESEKKPDLGPIF